MANKTGESVTGSRNDVLGSAETSVSASASDTATASKPDMARTERSTTGTAAVEGKGVHLTAADRFFGSILAAVMGALLWVMVRDSFASGPNAIQLARASEWPTIVLGVALATWGGTITWFGSHNRRLTTESTEIIAAGALVASIGMIVFPALIIIAK